jgi:6-pyruvoyltetrahydropterin/6-carboxytetrahydropterin synthase
VSTISVRCHFAAGHRILGLTGAGAKCRSPHGHTFQVTWTFQQAATDMALEFGELKLGLRQMIKDQFDHGFILDKDDDFCEFLRAGKHKLYRLNGPPTTELIAEEIAFQTLRLFPKAPLRSIELWEGPENCATWVRSTPLEIQEHGGRVVAVVPTGIRT